MRTREAIAVGVFSISALGCSPQPTPTRLASPSPTDRGAVHELVDCAANPTDTNEILIFSSINQPVLLGSRRRSDGQEIRIELTPRQDGGFSVSPQNTNMQLTHGLNGAISIIASEIRFDVTPELTDSGRVAMAINARCLD